jgi:hypothetical protein
MRREQSVDLTCYFGWGGLSFYYPEREMAVGDATLDLVFCCGGGD